MILCVVIIEKVIYICIYIYIYILMIGGILN